MVLESQRVLAATGGKSLGAVYHPIGNADYSSFILQAQASGAKAIAFANAGEQLVTLMKQWNEFGMNTGKQKPVAELMFLTDVHAMGPKIAKGLTTLTAWYWALNDETRAFGQRFFKLRGAMPTAPQAAVYSGVSHYLKAVAEARHRCNGSGAGENAFDAGRRFLRKGREGARGRQARARFLPCAGEGSVRGQGALGIL